ncbi:Glycosyltransferase involved in cell wall bisynthesis [Epsilonproteobacteria bacterium SCGC AD-308-E02]|nr:Glycosyltransferase involved in cell wall bisynthesis [Epsilonproteobacteria bacterium SCGC AD-308-E02]
MTIYIDITEFVKRRTMTGIQRVIKEYVQNALAAHVKIKILCLNAKEDSFELISQDEVMNFFKDVKNYIFLNNEHVDIFNLENENKVFFEMDSVWYSSLKRSELYEKLKKSNFKIVNFIYDLIPILFPEFSYKERVENFDSYLSAVYKYTDFIFFDSYSAQSDFLELKEKLSIKKNYATKVVYLGSDFILNPLTKTDDYEHILLKKYILFVGTIELRKSQDKVLEAFESLTTKYNDLNLVFIGKEGWNVEPLIEKILKHPLKDKKIFWFENIEDDVLSSFYKNAFIVTYMSKYEGYGLPIAESLNYNNVTIASKNSSLYEVGQDFVEYVLNGDVTQLVDIISLYHENNQMYVAKKDYIKTNYKPLSWRDTFNSIQEVFKDEVGLEPKLSKSFKLIDYNQPLII